MIEAPRLQLQSEAQLEEWLCNSPWAIANENLLVIGRQTAATLSSYRRYPDLLALDALGNIVVVELKRGRVPRDVVAQLLEYAAWASQLSSEELGRMANDWDGAFEARYSEAFEADGLPSGLGGGLRLFVAGEGIPDEVQEVCRFLRQNLALDICCVSYTTYQDAKGNFMVDSTVVVGAEHLATKGRSASGGAVGGGAVGAGAEGWNRGIPVRQIIWDAVQALTAGAQGSEFVSREVIAKVRETYPGANESTIRCQIGSECVNYPSRHQWPGGQDRYWRVRNGVFVLYNGQSADGA